MDALASQCGITVVYHTHVWTQEAIIEKIAFIGLTIIFALLGSFSATGAGLGYAGGVTCSGVALGLLLTTLISAAKKEIVRGQRTSYLRGFKRRDLEKDPDINALIFGRGRVQCDTIKTLESGKKVAKVGFLEAKRELHLFWDYREADARFDELVDED